MKRILVIIALCSPLLMQAQSIEHILKSIEQNNKELKAQKHAADATKMENRTNNNFDSFSSNCFTGIFVQLDTTSAISRPATVTFRLLRRSTLRCAEAISADSNF